MGRADRLQVRHRAPAHHATAGRGSPIRVGHLARARRLQERDEVGPRLLVFDAPVQHAVLRQKGRRVGEPGVEGFLIPHELGLLERLRIAREARRRAGLPPPQARQARPGHVAVGLERVTGDACAEHERATIRIAIRLGQGGPESPEKKQPHQGLHRYPHPAHRHKPHGVLWLAVLDETHELPASSSTGAAVNRTRRCRFGLVQARQVDLGGCGSGAISQSDLAIST